MTVKAFMNGLSRGKCVTGVLSGRRHFPCAFIASMQFWRVVKMLPKAKIYKPKVK